MEELILTVPTIPLFPLPESWGQRPPIVMEKKRKRAPVEKAEKKPKRAAVPKKTMKAIHLQTSKSHTDAFLLATTLTN